MKRIIVWIGAALLAAGCATQPLATASGRPDVLLRDTDVERAKSLVTGRMINRGYMPAKSDGMVVVYEKPGSMAEGILLGSAFNPEVIHRVKASFVPMDTGTRVVLLPAVISNPGSGFERAMTVEGKGAEGLQTMLADLADNPARAR
jgi:hypothetical protein